jgi:hypothetical protein
MPHKLAVLVLSFILVAVSWAQPVAAQTCTPAMAFVADVTIPDDTPIGPGATFVKTWRLKNAGPCEWPASYSVAFASGDPLGSVKEQHVAGPVPPGETTDISVEMKAPEAPGTYTGRWHMVDDAGKPFGKEFYVRLVAGAPGGTQAEPTPAPDGTQVEPTPAPDGTPQPFWVKEKLSLGVSRVAVQSALAAMGCEFNEMAVDANDARALDAHSSIYGQDLLYQPYAATGRPPWVTLVGPPEALLAADISVNSADAAQQKLVAELLRLAVPDKKELFQGKIAEALAATAKAPDHARQSIKADFGDVHFVFLDQAPGPQEYSVTVRKALGPGRSGAAIERPATRPDAGLHVSRDWVQSAFARMGFNFQEGTVTEEAEVRAYGRDMLGQPWAVAYSPGLPNADTVLTLLGPPEALLYADISLQTRDAAQQNYIADLLTLILPDHKDQVLKLVADGLAAGKQPTRLTEADYGDVHFKFEAKVSPYTKTWYYHVTLRRGPAPAGK